MSERNCLGKAEDSVRGKVDGLNDTARFSPSMILGCDSQKADKGNFLSLCTIYGHVTLVLS